MNQLRTRDFRPGDVLLKISDGSLVSRAISLGQNLRGQLNPRVVHAGAQPFSCSQFVVYVYQFVAAQCGMAATASFGLNDAKVSRSLLASKLQGNRFFTEAGYLMPKER